MTATRDNDRSDEQPLMQVRLTKGNWGGLASLALSLVGVMAAQWSHLTGEIVDLKIRVTKMETAAEAAKEATDDIKAAVNRLERRNRN